MNKTGKIFGIISLVIGLLLIAGAIALLIWWQTSIGTFADQSQGYLAKISELMPPSQSAIPEERADNRMPVRSVDGHDFIAVLEFLNPERAFPVGGDWGKNSEFPCRYYGSVYDGSIVIGANNQKGQLDFAKTISIGDPVFLTDMTGNRYSYSVTDILHRSSADNENLIWEDADLTLFVKNIYGFEYIILKCNVA